MLTRSLVLELSIKYSGADRLAGGRRSNVLRWARNHSQRDPVNLVDAIFAALGEQPSPSPKPSNCSSQRRGANQ